MTQRFGFSLVALAAIALCAMTAETASAWHRNRDCGSDGGGGSWGSNGSNGSNGSWGGSHGSNGSFGGLFSRLRRNGSNGSYGSNGGNGSFGSHGGSYSGNHDDGDGEEREVEYSDKQARSMTQPEVRYYGTREYKGDQNRQPAPGAPVINEGAQAPIINAPKNLESSTPQQPGVLNTWARPAPPDASRQPGIAGESAQP